MVYIPNLLEERRIFEWAGLGFSQEDCYLLQKNLKKLAKDSEAKNGIKLWGVIYGTQKNYIIIEGYTDQTAEKTEGDPNPEIETKGSGTNVFSYWVTDRIDGTFVLLPEVTPLQIREARNIKHIFTGNLEEEIISNPHFHGKEKHYLRAQIARIAHATTIIPKNLYKVKEDDKKEIEPEEEEKAKIPPFEELTLLSNWCHFPPSILKCGRTAHMQPEAKEGVDPEEQMKQLVAKEPYDRLKSLSADEKSTWSVRIYGDTCRYKDIRKKNTYVNYGLISLKSLVWPGMTTMFTGNKYISMYVGSGLKEEVKTYYPIFPPKILPEPDDEKSVEFPEVYK